MEYKEQKEKEYYIKKSNLNSKINELKHLKTNPDRNFLRQDINKLMTKLDEQKNEIIFKIETFYRGLYRNIEYNRRQLEKIITNLDLDEIEEKADEFNDDDETCFKIKRKKFEIEPINKFEITLNNNTTTTTTTNNNNSNSYLDMINRRINQIDKLSSQLNIAQTFHDNIKNYKHFMKNIYSKFENMFNDLPIVKTNYDLIGKCIQTVNAHDRCVNNIGQLSNGNLVSTSNDGTIKIWNKYTFKNEHTINAYQHTITSLLITDNDQILISFSSGTIQLFDYSSLDEDKLKLYDHHKSAITCMISYDLNHIITTSTDKYIRLWNINTGHVIRTNRNHLDAVNFAVVYKKEDKNKFVISGSNDKTIQIWNPAKDVLIDSLINESEINCLELLNDNHLLISGSNDGKIKLWNLNTNICFKVLNEHNGPVKCLKLIEDNRLLSYSRDKSLKLWNLNTYECLDTFKKMSYGVKCLDLLKSGEILIGSIDANIRILF